MWVNQPIYEDDTTARAHRVLKFVHLMTSQFSARPYVAASPRLSAPAITVHTFTLAADP